jgi:large subunit ribosomal protein L6
MSRVGIHPVEIPDKVSVTIEGSLVSVEGPLGRLERRFHDAMSISQENESLRVARPSDGRQHRELHGLSRSLLANMVTGVSQGYSKTLEMVGVGYRARQNGKGVTLSVMFSHPVEIQPQDGIELEVEGNNRIHVRGVDKQAVGQVAAQIRTVRPPNIYTGKGIRYLGEQVHLKAGKSARRAEV